MRLCDPALNYTGSLYYSFLHLDPPIATFQKENPHLDNASQEERCRTDLWIISRESRKNILA